MESEGTKKSWWVFAAVASAVAAALCRQTFALPSALLMIMLLVKSIRDRRVSVFFAYGAGLLPGIAYLVMLLLTGSLDDFIAQMTGRTELWETGVTKFVNAFWHSPVIWLTILLIGTLLIKIWYQETSKKTDRIVSILVAQKYIIIIGMILSSYLVFILPEHLFSLSLLMFWLTVAGFLLVTGWGGQVKGKGVMGWMILIAWTSSISAGDNAPVFSLGILAASSVLFIIRHLPPVRFKKPVEYLAAILLTIMAGWYVKAQKDNNYRDLPSNQLTVEGGSIFGDIKGVRLNPSTASYLSDLKKMYQSCGEPEGRFAIWPNNAVLYRILGSPNPFPLDWMQGPEFAGSEERVMKEVADKLTREDLFVLVEKYNVKWIAREKIPLDWSSGDYPYLRLLDSLYREVPSGSEWFRLFVRK
jgi:hypothetical protein